jgi:hypothetical protein
MRLSTCVSLTSLLGVLACQPAPSDTDPEAASTGEAPRILTFTSDVDTLSPVSTVRFDVIVTDPDGIGDVIGGTLTTSSGDPLGTFATSADEGAYQLTLAWDEFARAATPTFYHRDDIELVATFFDVAGSSSTATLTLTMSCEGVQYGGCGPCAGVCDAFDWDFGNTECVTIYQQHENCPWDEY